MYIIILGKAVGPQVEIKKDFYVTVNMEILLFFAGVYNL